MAEINDNVKKLYNSLKLEGYTDLGDIDQFNGKLKDSGARKSLYDALNRDGFTDLGEFGEFETKLGYEMPKDLVSPANDVTSSPLTSPVNAQPVTEQDNQGTQPEQEKGFWGTFAGDVIQRINAGGQDLGAGIFGLLDKGARGLENLTGGLVKSGGAFGQLADTFERDAAISRARSNRYQGKDYKQLWDEGDYAGMIGDIALTGAESLPMSIAAAASSVVNPAAGLVGIGAITASQKYDQLDESNPNMKEFPKLANAILTGLAEGGSEMLGAGVSNAWIKGLYKTMGKEKAEQAIQQGLLGKLREHFKRFGIFYEPVEEGLEEVSSQFSQNVTDKITGASPDIDVTEGLADSFVYGMGGGAYFSAANLPAYARQRVLERRANRQAETKRQDDSFRTATNNAYEAGYNDTSREGINATYNNAQSKKANLDAIDPGLAVTIDQYVNDNASEGEVISLMEGLDGDTRAAAEEYYNSQIAMRGVYDKALDDVDKKVKEMRDSVTPYVTTTEDGRQQYTTAQYDEGLFHGRVFVKSIEGNVAFIYRDGNTKPDMVDARRLSNITTGDLDAEMEKLRESMIMSEQVRLDLYTQHSPKTRYPEPGLVVFNGKDAFILQGQDENGDWSAFPAVFDKETGQVTAKENGTPSLLTERDILELQDNAYASQDIPVNEQVQQEQQPEQTIKTSEIEGENATSPSSGESNVSQETPQSDLDRVIASLPKKKDGSIDYKAMTPMQQYDYTSASEGPETALADLQQDVEAKRVELSGIEDKIAKATGGDRAALRDQARAKRKEYEELTAFYNSVAPAPASVETIQEEQEPSPIVETQEEPVAESVSEETTTTETAQEEPVSRTVNEEIEDLFDGYLDNDEIDQLVDANIKEAEKALGKIKKPAVGADKAAYLEKKKEYEAKREAAQAVVDHWNDVKAQIANNRAGVEQQAIPDIEEIGEPLNAHELAAEMLANGSIKLTRDSYMQETGFGDQETKGMFGLFASPEKGGVSVERAGEILTQADSEGGYNFIDPNEPNAARDVIIDVLSQAKTRGDLINYIKRRREEMANRERQAAYNDYAKWTQDNFGMTPEEWEAYNDAMDRDIRSIGITDEELRAIDGEIYDDMLAEQQDYAEIYGQLNQQQDETNKGNEQGRDQEPGEGSGEVLPTEQPVETGRDGVVEGERPVDNNINSENAGAQEGASGEIKPIGKGPFGNIYDQFRGKVKEAINFLRNIRDGEAIGALYHKDIGDISLVWGNDKAGLKKILKKHPEVSNDLQGILDGMNVVEESDNRIKLESPTHFAVVSKEFLGQPRDKWLLTAYEKKETPRLANSSMDVESNLNGKSDDTATRQNQDVSNNKIINNQEESQDKKNSNNEKPKNKKDNGLLSESDFIDKKVKEAFESRKDKKLTREEWEDTDDFDNAFNQASDSYPDYIKQLKDNGDLQLFYDNGSIGDRIKIREAIETAGFNFDDYVDASKEKEEAKRKREEKRQKRQKEIMSRIGLLDENGSTRYSIGEIAYTDMTDEQRAVYDSVVGMLEDAGIQVEVLTDDQMKALADNNEITLEAKRKSETRKDKDRVNGFIDEAISMVTGKSVKDVRSDRLRREQERRDKAKKIYDSVLDNDFNDVTLRLINEYIDEATPNNPYGRRISQRVPQKMERRLHEGNRTNAIDALFTRISESAVGKAGEKLEGNRGSRERAKEKKKELLKGWAIATGNWHTDISDFTNDKEPVARGKDSDVYYSKDGEYVIKFSKGKEGNRFPSDIDAPNLFSYIFPNSAYDILGYGEIDGNFVTILRQPIVEIESALTEDERVEYMRSLGFDPINKDNTAFSNGEVIVADLQKGNVVRTKEGNVRVIDADVKLHTKDLGGKYSYPPVDVDTENRINLFKDNNGIIYGATIGGKIYLNGSALNPETPIHEYTHIWDEACRRNNPELWNRGVDLMRQTSVWNDVKNDPNYSNLETDDEIASEVHSRLTGKDGARILEEMVDSSNKQETSDLREKLKKWLDDFWWWLKDTMMPWTKNEVSRVTLNDFVNMPLKDLANGKRINQENNTVRFRFIGERGAYNLDQAEEATTRMDNLNVARNMEKANNEKKMRIEKLKTSNPVEITGDEIEPSDDLKQYKKNALEYGKRLRGEYTNKDTGVTVILSSGNKNGGLKEVLQHDINDIDHLKSVAAIPGILENSIYIETVDNEEVDKNPNVARYHYYVCGLKIGDTDYTVKAVVAEQNNGNRYYDHKLTEIEKGKLLDELAQLNQTSPSGLSSTGELEETEQSRPAASRGGTQSSPVSKYKDTRLMSILQTNDIENAKKIKLATGWERGADGKWRYETPDFSFKENPVVVPFDGYVLTNLGALINDEELFKAYPELEDMTVQYQNLPLGMLASYSPKTNRFPAMITMDDEFIRKKENPEWRKLVEKMEQEPVIKKWIEEMEREPFDETLYNKAEKDFKESPLWEKYNDLLLGKGKVPRYVSGFSGEKILAHEIQHAIQDIEGFAKGGNTRNTQYNNFAGEVESRNVEKRFDLSPEGRNATLAEETEDVAREDQIFINNALNNNKSLFYEPNTRNNQSKEARPEANREDSRARTETVEANGNFGAQDNTPVGSTGRETAEANDGVYNGDRVNGQQTGNYDRASDQGTGRENRPANGDIDGQDGQRAVGYDAGRGEQGQRDIDSGERNNLGNIQPGNDRGATDNGDRGTNNVDKRLDREGDGIGRTYQGRQRIIEVSNETAGSLGQRVTVITDINEIPDGDAKRAISQGRKVTGWYDIPSRTVYVYAPNVADENEAKRTILHETVGHKGLRQLIGERDYDSEMARLFGLLPKKERDAVADRASRRYDGDVSVAMDEYLAEKAELDEKPSWWEKAVSSVRDMLRKIGIDVKLTDNDVKYLLWRSRQGLANANATAMAEDMVMRDKLGIDPKRGGDSRFRTAGERSVHDHSNIDQYATERQVGSAKEQYERTLKTSAYKFQEAMQDSMLGLKTLMEAVEKESGKKIMDYENAYIAENAMSSKNLSEMEVSRRTVQKNMIDEITKLEKRGTTFDEISDYLIAKHGIERNRLMALKKALSKNEETYQKNMEDYIAGRDAIRANGKTWEEQQRELDELAESYGANLAEDYSGFNEMFPPADNSTEYDREAAYGYVTDYENAYDTSGVLRSVAEMNASILDKQRNSGLMSDNAYKTISDMYQYYVPLRGWEQTTADEAYTYLTTDRGVFNAPVKTAYGRRSKAANPIFNMVNMAESGIVEGNRNLMKQRFLTMAQNHKTDLVSVSDMWVKEVEVMDEDGNMVKEWQAQFPTIPDNATPEQVESIVAKFNERMEELSKDKDSKIKRSRDMGNIPYKILPREKREHQVIVKRNGKEYVLTINGNPRAAQALNGLTNPDNNKTGWYGTLERSGKWLNRHLAANYTTRNPGFVISNFLRDMIYSNSMVWVKENPLYALRFNRNFAKVNPAKMFSLLRKYENGTLDMNNETERYFNEFMRGGGETGYTNIRDVEAIRSDIAKEMRYSNKRLSIGKAFNILGKWMDLLNRSVENNSRFAAYVTSRQEGRSVDRSVYDAKEISVNFNKKGSGSKFLGEKDMGVIGNMAAFTSGAGQSLYVFWNAGVQGVSNTAKIAKNNKLKFAGLGATYFLLGSLINVAMQELGGDDDDEAGDYYDLPEYVRRNNICIRNGVGGWITIPLPIELRAVYGLGELAAGLATGREKMSDQKVAMKVAEQMSQVMPLDMLGDGGGFMAFVPSSVKPLVEAGVNVDWTGLPIYKDNDFNKGMPEWTKAYSNVDPTLLALSKNLNEWTGGDKYTVGAVNINPAIVEHILSGYLGGFESMRAQLVKSIDTATGEREFEWRNVPVLSRVIREGDERTRMKAVNDAYYENMKMMKEIHQQELGYDRERKNPANTPIEIAEYSKKYSDLRQSDKYKAYKEIEIRNNKYLYLKDLYEKTKDERLVEHMDNMKISMNEIADMIK